MAKRYEYNANEDQQSSNAGNKLTYLLIGGGIGAIVALLFAPKSGQELRGDLTDVTRKGIDRTRETAQQLRENSSEYYSTAREQVDTYTQQAREQVGNYTQQARETVNTYAARVGDAYTTAADRLKSSQKPNTQTAALDDGEIKSLTDNLGDDTAKPNLNAAS